MKFYYEFKGNKLLGTECFSYQEAKVVLVKIVDQCVKSYRRNYGHYLLTHDELRLQSKILSQLKLVVSC